jgi:integrase
MTRRAGIGHWHAHEGRHTAVSIMSSNGVPLQEISDTVGHKSTHVTETVYRHVIVPAIRGGSLTPWTAARRSQQAAELGGFRVPAQGR